MKLKGSEMLVIAGLFLILGVTLIGCVYQSKPTPTPTTPEPWSPGQPLTTATPTSMWLVPGVSLERYVANADTIVIGWVTEGLPERKAFQHRTQEGSTVYKVYIDWVIKVEKYVLMPLLYDHLIVRIWEATESNGFRMPVKGPHLREGEHVLLFLAKEHGYWKPPTLGDNEFTLTGGLTTAGKYIIKDSKVRHGMCSFAPWEPLDEFIAKIKVAKGKL